MAGRFMCVAGYPNMQDYLARFAAKHPDQKILLKKYVNIYVIDRVYIYVFPYSLFRV
jgi:hypothetical protein